MPETQGHKNKWITLKGGIHVYLDGEGNVSKGPNVFIGKSIAQLKYENDATPVPRIPSKSYNVYRKEAKSNADAALKYYQGEMQGHYVDADIEGNTEQIFFSRATGKGKNDLLAYMDEYKDKSEFVQYIPNVISSGTYVGREDVIPGHGMERIYSAFHVFEKHINHNDKQYKVITKIGEHLNGVKMFSFYYFGKSESTAKDSAPARWLALRPTRLACDASYIPELPPEDVIVGFEVEEVKPVFSGHFAGLNSITLGETHG